MTNESFTGDRIDMMKAFLAAFNDHDVEAIVSFFSEDCEFDTPRGPTPFGRQYRGKDEVREGISGRFTGIPDVSYEDDIHWACGDRGVSEWTLKGTTTDGVRIEVRGCDLFEFSGDKVRRKDSFWKIVE
jgi:ketosteroid isomerase-like protein